MSTGDSFPTTVYVASSWRNPMVEAVVHVLQSNGLSVFDFRNPPDDQPAFSFQQVDPNWQRWTLPRFLRELRDNPTVRHAFERDRIAIERCDILVMVMPCGKSGHLELGYAAGLNKRTVIFAMQPIQPELMYGFAGKIVSDFAALLEACTVRPIR